MKCGHPNRVRLYSIDRGWPDSWALGECNVCRVCGEWISLGPANDSPPAVQREIALAACIADVCQLWEPGRDRTEQVDRFVEGFASQPLTTTGGPR